MLFRQKSLNKINDKHTPENQDPQPSNEQSKMNSNLDLPLKYESRRTRKDQIIKDFEVSRKKNEVMTELDKIILEIKQIKKNIQK